NEVVSEKSCTVCMPPRKDTSCPAINVLPVDAMSPVVKEYSVSAISAANSPLSYSSTRDKIVNSIPYVSNYISPDSLSAHCKDSECDGLEVFGLSSHDLDVLLNTSSTINNHKSLPFR